jgi:ketosteroid isomerase-like protein
MRVWEVSHQAREVGQAIDLPHYERPPVETLQHALDRHAEEVYAALPSDRHRDVARLVFQQLTDRDAENREVRRPTPLRELTSVAIRRAPEAVTAADAAMVNEVIAAFAAEGRAFVVVNAQQDVDISHESFIRKWERLRKWVEEENRSRRIYTKLADVASSWDRGEASLYRGPELAEARRWWQREQPTREWAERYAPGFEVAHRFLDKSLRWRRLRRSLLFGNAALLLVGAIAIAILMAVSRNQARKAEAAALEARNATETSKQELAEANRLRTEALDAQRRGESARADALSRQAQQVEQQANARPVLTPGELSELQRLQKQEVAWKETETSLRKQLDAANAAKTTEPVATAPAPAPRTDLSSADRAELERLRKAEADWERQRTQLLQQQQQQQQAPAPAVSSGATLSDVNMIEAVLLQYQRAYQRLDAKAVAALVPSLAGSGLDASFGQLRSYGMEIVDPQISVAGDTATVKCVRRVSPQPKVGSRPSPREVPTVITLKRNGASWVIASVQ